MTVATDNLRLSQGEASPRLETQGRMTLKEFLTYDDGTETRYELVDGVLVEMGYESTINTWIAGFLMFAFRDLGIPHYCLSPKHAIEVRGRYANSRWPDLLVHSEASAAAIDGRSEACLELTDPAPLLVLEVVSPGKESEPNYKRDYEQKPGEYADRGVAEFWRVDPEREWVQIGRLRDGQYEFETFKGEDAIVSPTFPGLRLTAAQILAAGR
jgi:Uma2 family endonuclease